jgi:hypothetical protein
VFIDVLLEPLVAAGAAVTGAGQQAQLLQVADGQRRQGVDQSCFGDAQAATDKLLGNNLAGLATAIHNHTRWDAFPATG